MLNRRELITSVTSAPLLAACSYKPANPFAMSAFLEEPHTIAVESARGYRAISNKRANLIIAPGIRDITPELCIALVERVRSGASLLLESGLCFSSPDHTNRQRQILKQGLALELLPLVLTAEANYVTYAWPLQKLVRSFHAVIPVVCAERDVIARFQGLPVCAKIHMGRGCLVYLGSLLGAGLLAEEREARAVGNALVSNT
jgi:hypothetical protein